METGQWPIGYQQCQALDAGAMARRAASCQAFTADGRLTQIIAILGCTVSRHWCTVSQRHRLDGTKWMD